MTTGKLMKELKNIASRMEAEGQFNDSALLYAAADRMLTLQLELTDRLIACDNCKYVKYYYDKVGLYGE